MDLAAAPADVEPSVSPAAAASETPTARGFYRSLEALAPSKHGALKIDRSRAAFDFARGVNLAPISVGEFGQAALSYPIVFVGEAKVPCAVMGLRRGVNAFINADGAIDAAHYIPATLRQYPFALAKDPDAERIVLCVDRGADMVNETTGVALFEGGEPSSFTEEAMKFLRGMERQRAETEAFIKTLIELDLFETKELKMMKRGEPGEARVLTTYDAISETKLAALAADTLGSLVTRKYMFLIGAHQVSLFNWNRLTMLSLQEAEGQERLAG
ncbi:MAG: SapC family protein [Pseudomonadota bacterium]